MLQLLALWALGLQLHLLRAPSAVGRFSHLSEGSYCSKKVLTPVQGTPAAGRFSHLSLAPAAVGRFSHLFKGCQLL